MKYNVHVILKLLILSATTESAIAAITNVSVTPTSAKSGTIFKFTANLDAPLTTGNKVKIDLGKGLASMTGKGINYSLSRAIYTEGKQTYKVGIYNAKNVLQGKVSSGSYNIELVTPVSIDKPKLPTVDVINAFKISDSIVGFAVTLSAPLPSKDYRVKIEAVDEKINDDISYYADNDFKSGKNFYMKNDGKNFYQQGYSYKGVNLASGIYSVGIYDAKGNLVSNKRSGNFNAIAPKDNQAPTLEVSLPNNVIFGKNLTGKLVSKDSNGDIVSVKVSWGNGGDVGMVWNIAGSDNTLNLDYSYNNHPEYIGHDLYPNIVAYDAFSTKTEYSTTVFLQSDEPKKINISGNSYSKIANDGSELSDAAQLGNNPRDWACTRDNDTGFVWEIKTDDTGFRNRYRTLKWLKRIPNSPIEYIDKKCEDVTCNTDSYTKAVNEIGLCGIKSWQVPTVDQLNTLIYCSDGKYNEYNELHYICSGNLTPIKIPGRIETEYRYKLNVKTPTIDTVYFPDVENGQGRIEDTIFETGIKAFITRPNPTSSSVILTDFYEGRNYGGNSGSGFLRLIGCQTGWYLNESNKNECVKNNH